jgi:hypothetical protein
MKRFAMITLMALAGMANAHAAEPVPYMSGPFMSAEGGQKGWTPDTFAEANSVKTERYKDSDIPRNWLNNGYPPQVTVVKQEVKEEGRFPTSWQGHYCLGDGGGDVFVYHRTAEQCNDFFFNVNEHGNHAEFRSRCDLMEGAWDDETSSYEGMYDCYSDSTRTIEQVRFTSLKKGELRVEYKGRVRSPL